MSKSESYLKDHIRPDTTVEKLDIYMLLKAAGQIETALSIAAHTPFEPKHSNETATTVDCIFIDPPYITGNEGWCYNDRVNSPMIREWLSSNPGGDRGRAAARQMAGDDVAAVAVVA